MRFTTIALLSLLVVGGCMHPGMYRYAHEPDEPRYVQPSNEIPPGKILVQDVRTGQLILVDDPNAAPAPEPERAPAYRPGPAPTWDRPAPPPAMDPQPSPGARVGPHPRQGKPSRRPEISISVEGWAAGITGTMTGHDAWLGDEADFEEDLDLETAAAISLDFALRFHRGPSFRFGLTSMAGDGTILLSDIPAPASPILGYVEREVEMSMLLVDLAFSPLSYEGRWGSLNLETGLRYALGSIEVENEDEFSAEGVMLTLGGDIGFGLYKDLLFMDVGGALGLGGDAAYFQFDLGITLKTGRNFHMRLGYRALGMGMLDNMDESDERSFGLGAAGPSLEMGFTF